MQIIRSGQSGGFEEISSDGGSGGRQNLRFCFAAACGGGNCAASPHPAAPASRHRRLSGKKRIRQRPAVDKAGHFGYNFIVVFESIGV